MRISDEELNMLGDKFNKENINSLVGIHFEQYVEIPEHYDAVIEKLKTTGGVIRKGHLCLVH